MENGSNYLERMAPDQLSLQPLVSSLLELKAPKRQRLRLRRQRQYFVSYLDKLSSHELPSAELQAELETFIQSTHSLYLETLTLIDSSFGSATEAEIKIKSEQRKNGEIITVRSAAETKRLIDLEYLFFCYSRWAAVLVRERFVEALQNIEDELTVTGAVICSESEHVEGVGAHQSFMEIYIEVPLTTLNQTLAILEKIGITYDLSTLQSTDGIVALEIFNEPAFSSSTKG
ncbi:MAG TPA: hypothetical protein VD999_04295 [Vitreimonas sp.]|nr:hypothetical protein [Vitreimonas sp.]